MPTRPSRASGTGGSLLETEGGGGGRGKGPLLPSQLGLLGHCQWKTQVRWWKIEAVTRHVTKGLEIVHVICFGS